MPREILLSAVYPQPPREVWRMLTDRDLLAQWLMPNDFAPRVGHRFTFRTDPAPGFDGVVHCEVLELVAERKLAISWRGGGNDTIVTFTIEPLAAGTRLRLSHAGFAGLKGRLIGALLGNGWRNMLDKKLPRLLHGERPGEPGGGCDRDASGLWRTLNRVWGRG
jgi:uncharacterized protein YndB with AHSA1/START domain